MVRGHSRERGQHRGTEVPVDPDHVRDGCRVHDAMVKGCPVLAVRAYARRTDGASRPKARARSTASWRPGTPSLAYRWRRWVLTVFAERNSSLAISCTVRWVGR